MSAEEEGPISEPSRDEVVLTVEEIKRREDLLKQKINLQRLVMHKLHRSFPDYESKPKNPKRTQMRGLAASEVWAQDVGEVKSTSYAAVFDDAYSQFIDDPNNLRLLEVDLDLAVTKLIDEMMEKRKVKLSSS